MTYLILKDLMLQKRLLGLMFLYVALFTFSFKSMGEGQPVAIIAMVGYMLVMFGAAWEEKNNSDVLWNSLPVPRWKIVGARYLSVFVYVLLVIPVYWLMSTGLSLLGFPPMAALNVAAILGGTASVILMSSLYLPIYYALGYIKSRYLNFLVFFGVFFLASMLPRLFPEKPAWVDDLVARLGVFQVDALIMVAIALAFAILMGISFLLSVLLYRRREF